jgi:hypothetical protein
MMSSAAAPAIPKTAKISGASGGRGQWSEDVVWLGVGGVTCRAWPTIPP